MSPNAARERTLRCGAFEITVCFGSEPVVQSSPFPIQIKPYVKASFVSA